VVLGRAGAAATARARKLDDDLQRLTRGLGSRHYPTVDKVQPRLAAIATSAGSAACCTPRSAPTRPPASPPWPGASTRPRWAAEQATDGWYAPLTNLDPAQVDAARVLARDKGQEVLERRYGSFKGPLAVAPMFLPSNRRIQALVTVICLALLIFCLVERQVRRAIAPTSPSRAVCRPAGQAHRPAGLRGARPLATDPGQRQ
jgi:hypothetical protein